MRRWICSLIAIVAAACSPAPIDYLGGPSRTGVYSGSVARAKPTLVREITAQGSVEAAPAVTPKHVIVGSDARSVVAYASADGLPVWEVATDGAVASPPTQAAGRTIFGTDAGELVAVGADGKVEWKFDAGAAIDASPLVVDAVVYVGDRSGVVHAMDAIGGAPIWRAMTAGPISGSCAHSGRCVLAASFDGGLYCLEPETGESVWSWRSSSPLRATPAVDSGTVFVSAGTRVAALAAETGSVGWVMDLAAGVETSTLVAPDAVVVALADRSLVALSRSDGAELWRTKLDADPHGDLAGAGGVVLVPTTAGIIAADWGEGEVLWSYPTPAPVTSGITVRAGTMYFGDTAGTVHIVR